MPKTAKSTTKRFQKQRGDRKEVWLGIAKMTSGGLTKDKLMLAAGTSAHPRRIVSKARVAQGKKALKYLDKAGFVVPKGTKPRYLK